MPPRSSIPLASPPDSPSVTIMRKTGRPPVSPIFPHKRSESFGSNSVSSSASASDLASIESTLLAYQERYGEKDERVGQVWNVLGNFHFRSERHKEALDAYKQAVQCSPGAHLADALANLGTVYWTTGQLEESVKVLKQALARYALDSEDGKMLQVATVHHQLGLVYCLMGDYDAAMASLKRARKMRELKKEHQAVAKTYDAMGKVLFRKGDIESALVHHRQALGILRVIQAPKVTTLENIYRIHKERYDWQLAMEILKEIIKDKRSLLAKAHSSLPRMAKSAKSLADSLLEMAFIHQEHGQTLEMIQCQQEASLLCQETNVMHDL